MQAQIGHLAFGPFCLDTETPRLLRDDVELELRPQAQHALRVLVQNSGRCVGYDEMISGAWHGICVSRHTVAVTVGEAKKALREYGSWISYHPRFGYRLDIPKSEDLIKNAWHYWKRHTREGLDKALSCFQEAAQTPGGDFRALVGIARSCLMLGTFSLRPPREMYAAFLEAHRKTVELIGLTPDLRSDRGQALHMFERRVAEAEAELLRAKRENSRAFGVHCRLAVVYGVRRRFNEAFAMIEEGYAADSLWPMTAATETMIRLWQGDFESGVACGRKSLDLHPYFPYARSCFAQALEYSGKYEEALEQHRLACIMAPDVYKLRADEAGCLARGGRFDEATALLEDLRRIRRTTYVDAWIFSSVLAALGRPDEALDELEQAERENSPMLMMLDVDSRLDSLRHSPRFTRLRARAFRNAAAMPPTGLKTVSATAGRLKEPATRQRVAS